MATRILTGARLFDGFTLADGQAVVIEDDRIAAIRPDTDTPGAERLAGGILAPGFVDLQVNGGGGLMLDGSADAATLPAICAAHARLGCAGILPTLITAAPDAVAHVLGLAASAARVDLPGFLGLHLEGPHLDVTKKGAHNAAWIRPMTEADVAVYLDAARRLPALMLTVSPRAATPDQIARLSAAGVRLFLGHTDCTAAEAQVAFAAGASGVTHLFNAMSQMSARAPGLVGAALAGGWTAGLIADGIHVAPEGLRVALAASPALYLASDAMAVAGTGLPGFRLDGREVHRAGGRLTLADGTLAGADLTLAQALQVLVTQAGCAPARALAMATRIPADVIGAGDRLGRIAPGRRADLLWLDDALALRRIWQGGREIAP